MRTVLVLLIAFATILAACAPMETVVNETEEPMEPEVPVEPEEPMEPEVPEDPEEPETEPIYTIEGVEGELITLRPEAIDPDNDMIEYSFSSPFDENGEWQTVLDDEGSYTVTVTAEDGMGGRTTETVRVLVTHANRPPVIDCSKVLVNEGDKVNLHDYCTVTDIDTEEIIVTYGGWMTSWRYETSFDDAGEHTVIITASDKLEDEILHTVRENVTVTVQNVNRPPFFGDDFPSVISATENDVVTIPSFDITDPDKDSVTVTYSEPFNNNGVWKTELGDSGEYTVDIVATDGENTAKRTVTVSLSMLNTAPVLKPIADISVDEGELITLPIDATDREGDKLSVTVSGWMRSDSYKTTYEDAGSYTVKVEVTDGEFTTEEIVKVTVNNVNRPPVFVVPA